MGLIFPDNCNFIRHRKTEQVVVQYQWVPLQLNKRIVRNCIHSGLIFDCYALKILNTSISQKRRIFFICEVIAFPYNLRLVLNVKDII